MSDDNRLNADLAERQLPELWPNAPATPDETAWTSRRRELLACLSRYVYGRIPEDPVDVKAEVLAQDERFCAGKAVLQTIKLSMELPEGCFSFPVQIILPHKPRTAGTTADWSGFPFFVHLAFRPDVPDKYLPAEELVDEGFALFNICYQDIVPDQNDQFQTGLPVFFPFQHDQPDRWGKISMWSWAASRVLDYALQEAKRGLPLDPDRAAVIGHSRLGKTALWAGANDPRFNYVISNDSGCSGAALTRGKSGEDVEAITRVFPHWFCPAYRQFAGKPGDMPFDQHFLLAASAPRHVYVASAAGDSWADPDAEFLSAFAASEIYQRLGITGLVTPDRRPADDCLLTEGTLAYHRRPGLHYLSRTDWQRFMAYVRR